MTTKPQTPARTIRIVCISDTHELHRELDIPSGDILIHAGDFTFFSKRPSMVADFDSWLGELPHPTKVVVPGNHEFLIEAGTVPPLRNATLLINRGVKCHGLKIWGSPVTVLSGGAFGRSDPEDRRRIYAEIPLDTDILVTHGPPYGILDRGGSDAKPHGCQVLLEAVQRINPRLHVFGHAHGGYGSVIIGRTQFANASVMTEDFGPDNPPLVFPLTVSVG